MSRLEKYTEKWSQSCSSTAESIRLTYAVWETFCDLHPDCHRCAFYHDPTKVLKAINEQTKHT